MIASLKGTVESIEGHSVIIDVSGVGYLVLCTQSTISKLDLGTHVFLIIYTEVREEAIKLYGFLDRLEKQTFLLLNLVKGIGPKSALDILSRIEAKLLLRIIAASDVAGIKAVKGIGQKTAERVILELKDKVAEFALEQAGDKSYESLKSEPIGENQNYDDSILALLALGFSKKDSETAVLKVKNALIQKEVQPASSGDIVREALKEL